MEIDRQVDRGQITKGIDYYPKARREAEGWND